MTARFRTPIFILLLGGYVLIPMASAQTEDPPKPSKSESEIITKCYEIDGELHHFEDMVRKLMAIVDSQADSRVRERAASTLREFRAIEAVPVLVKNLTSVFESFGGGRNSVPGIERYTCALALYDIGLPAVDPLIELIRDEKADGERIKVAGCTIAAITGKAQAETILGASAVKYDSDDIRKRFAAAIAAIESLTY